MLNGYGTLCTGCHTPLAIGLFWPLALATALTMSLNSALSEAPPTRKPSTSGHAESSGAFFALALPPYWMRIRSAVSLLTSLASHARSAACVSWACLGEAVTPVPIDQTGSYASTILSGSSSLISLKGLSCSTQWATTAEMPFSRTQRLADGVDNLEAVLVGVLALGREQSARLGRCRQAKFATTLRVSDEHPGDAHTFHLLDGHLAGVRATTRKIAVLRRYDGAIGELSLHERDVQRRGADIHLAARGITGVNVSDEFRKLSGRLGVALPVAAYNWNASG